MNPDRRLVLKAGIGLAVGLGSGLVATTARAHEYYSTTLRISHPWCRATASDARDAIVCMTFDEVLQSDRLVGVETPVADRAEMGGRLAGPRVDFVIPADRTTALDEDGTHVRLVGLLQPLEIARSYPLKLVFEVGGVVDVTLDVAFAGRR